MKSKNIDLGERILTDQNHSKVVTVPPAFYRNWLGKSRKVRMKMSPDGRLILTPVDKEKGKVRK